MNMSFVFYLLFNLEGMYWSTHSESPPLANETGKQPDHLYPPTMYFSAGNTLNGFVTKKNNDFAAGNTVNRF